jgi:glycosyltransferase involved in cell wall biosynthesis
MACGTPVIAFKYGSVIEVIEEGVSGFVVDTLDQAVAAVGRLENLERRQVRAAFERRFTVERMTSDYARIYQALFASNLASSTRSIAEHSPLW